MTALMSTSTRWIMIATHTFFIYLACFNGGAVKGAIQTKARTRSGIQTKE